MLPTTMQSTSSYVTSNVAIKTFPPSVPLSHRSYIMTLLNRLILWSPSHHPQLLPSYDEESRDACNLMTTGFE
jgi:hypothetical protein